MALVQDAGNNLLIRLVLVLFLLYIMSVEDVRERALSVIRILPFGAAGLILSILSAERDIAGILSGTAIGAVLIAISAVTQGKIGMGDGLVVAAVGMTLGFSLTFSLVFFSFLAGSIYALFLLVVKRKSRDTEYPYMPFLFVTYVGVLCVV
ncbi:MAG: prepilin peptidase [Lachnospiraceae bacterium]|nr:prepilin peptidase [Lachnospiraceae bacterium]